MGNTIEPVEKCDFCGGTGTIVVAEIVCTRGMALAAGQPEVEGAVETIFEDCPSCFPTIPEEDR